ncbi:MAG: hypothetical protein VKJ24_10800 [Synechococcales bacterium]|nr:hypothetical protein [Synechococcales bacterium]
MKRSPHGLQATHEILRSGQNLLALSKALVRSNPMPLAPPILNSLFLDPLTQLEKQLSPCEHHFDDSSHNRTIYPQTLTHADIQNWKFDRVPSPAPLGLRHPVWGDRPEFQSSHPPAANPNSQQSDPLWNHEVLIDRPLRNHPSEPFLPNQSHDILPVHPANGNQQTEHDRSTPVAIAARANQSTVISERDQTDLFPIPILNSNHDLSRSSTQEYPVITSDRSNIGHSSSDARSETKLIQSQSRLNQLLQANLTHHSSSLHHPPLRTSQDAATFDADIIPQNHPPLPQIVDRPPLPQAIDRPITSPSFAPSQTNQILTSPHALTVTQPIDLSATLQHPTEFKPQEPTSIAGSEVAPEVRWFNPPTPDFRWDIDNLWEQLGDRLEREYLRTYGTSG